MGTCLASTFSQYLLALLDLLKAAAEGLGILHAGEGLHWTTCNYNGDTVLLEVCFTKWLAFCNVSAWIEIVCMHIYASGSLIKARHACSIPSAVVDLGLF